MLYRKFLGLGVSALAVALMASAADARPRYRLAKGERMIVLKPRSFLDS